MSKHFTGQRFIFKIHSSRLKKSKWNLNLPLQDARDNDELVSLGDSLMLRWIDELNGITDADYISKKIKKEIKTLKKESHSIENKKEIKRLYSELDKVQFKPDYMCVIMDRVSDYYRACKGFTVNGIKYVRLLGTNGGVKNSTIVFVSERLAPELRRRIENGRDPNVKLIPAKYEAYRALTCSGSVPVSMPHGVAVVNDCETSFVEDVISMRDGDGDEPVMEYVNGMEITLDESDGYGIMLPSLAQRWSDELRLGYMAAGMNTRCAFEKGMVFTFDFLDFADNVAGTRIIHDAWGHEVDLSNVELILTTSMLKLWESYDSIEHYLACCAENHYTFGIPKTTPETLDNERGLNYQFIQPYELDDADIAELTRHTEDIFRDVLTWDYAKALLFLKGVGLDEHNIDNVDDDFVKAMMIDERVFGDPYVKRVIFNMIRKKINEAKVGVLQVHGNYSIVCGDPYALCQNMFMLPVTGLLKKGEIYSRYWLDEGVDDVVCYRAPMTSMNNIRKAKIARGEQVEYWFRYMNTCTCFNAFDTMAAALNGCDKDGDLVFTTNNDILLRKFVYKPTVMCEQHKAEKVLITEDNLIESNINSFGDEIGKITNYITTMFEVQSGFDKESEEYKTLDYRITCGEHLQQNAIDKSKGIISKPMPRFWYDFGANKITQDMLPGEESNALFQQSIVADKKPYFMTYIYPKLMKQYKDYIKHSTLQSRVRFEHKTEELLAIPEDERSEELKEYIMYYHRRMPVGMNDSVMNRICRRIENGFDRYLAKNPAQEEFDYSILKSGMEYAPAQYKKVLAKYNEYTAIMESRREDASDGATSDPSDVDIYDSATESFIRTCSEICTDDKTFCDIMLDICYKSQKSKQFVWSLCGETIISNLLEKSEGVLRYPTRSENGDIEFAGMRFEMKERKCAING